MYQTVVKVSKIKSYLYYVTLFFKEDRPIKNYFSDIEIFLDIFSV